MSEEKKGKLFPKPVGPAKRRWNNVHASTRGPQLCEACGTDHPELDINDDDWYIWDRFLGLEIVEDCCGRAIDVLYKEFVEEFVTVFLKEFAKDPTNPKFAFFKFILSDCLKAAHDKSAELVQETATMSEELADLEE